MVSVKAQQPCTCHPNPPNLEVLPVLQQVAEPHQQVLQKDLQCIMTGVRPCQPFPALTNLQRHEITRRETTTCALDMSACGKRQTCQHCAGPQLIAITQSHADPHS